MQARERLVAGVGLLSPLMDSHDFSFTILTATESSGGESASGEFRRGEDQDLRRLELHVRHSLGLVRYHIGDASLSHDDYMRGLHAANQYPGFSTEPLDAFAHLLHDLQRFASDFLSGPGDEFNRCVQEAERRVAVPGFKRLSEPR